MAKQKEGAINVRQTDITRDNAGVRSTTDFNIKKLTDLNRLNQYIWETKVWLETENSKNPEFVAWAFANSANVEYLGTIAARARNSEKVIQEFISANPKHAEELRWSLEHMEYVVASVKLATFVTKAYDLFRAFTEGPGKDESKPWFSPSLFPGWEAPMDRSESKNVSSEVTLPNAEKYLQGRPAKGIRKRKKVVVHRLQLLFSKKDLERLESLREHTTTTTAADVIRRALMLYEMLLSANMTGKDVIFEDRVDPKIRTRLKLS